MADYDRFGRDRHGRSERGMTERAGDEVRSWFGDDQAAQRRRMDEREHERWSGNNPARHEQDRGRDDRWSGGGSASGRDRGYSSDREYGDRDYGWGASERARNWSPSGDYDRGYMPESEYRGVDYDRPFRSDSADRSTADYRRYDYTRPEYTEYGRQAYGGAYARDRSGAREWSTERWRVPGPHVGRGPRGYQRSDDRIREEINDRLTDHGLIDASDVECRVQNGEVTLTGFVDSRAAKRAAEDLAEDVHGVREVHNQLRVRSHASDEGVGRTSVLGLTESQVQTQASVNPEGRPSKTRG